MELFVIGIAIGISFTALLISSAVGKPPKPPNMKKKK